MAKVNNILFDNSKGIEGSFRPVPKPRFCLTDILARFFNILKSKGKMKNEK